VKKGTAAERSIAAMLPVTPIVVAAVPPMLVEMMRHGGVYPDLERRGLIAPTP